MKSIQFSTGTKQYCINGDENNVISVNLTDLNIPARIRRAGETLSELVKPFEDRDEIPTPEELEVLDQTVRSILDDVFGTDVCSHAFGNVNCFSITESGDFLFQAFLDAFLPVIQADLEAFHKNRKPAESKADKYLLHREKAAEADNLTKEQKLAMIADLLA